MTEIEELFKSIRIDNVVCSEGMEWLQKCTSFEDVWGLCPRADWMILNAGRMGYKGQLNVRKFIYRITTEIFLFKERTIRGLASTNEEMYAIQTLGEYVEGKTSIEEVSEAGLQVWKKAGRDQDVTIIIATSCMWGSDSGSIMAAKAVLGRMNAITDDEKLMEGQASKILKECVTFNDIMKTYREFMNK